MYARVVTVQVHPSKADESIALYEANEALWRQQKGFKGASLLFDRDTGNCVSITYWETRADLEAAEGFYREGMAGFAALFTTQPVRAIYEVAAELGLAKALGET